MSISINTNDSSLKVQLKLSSTTRQLGQVFERLSSGVRINHAADDSAGLAVADKLRADAAIAGQAVRNANDGISLVSIADSALAEISDVLTRMQELAQQSANGTLTTAQRSSLATEFVSLGSEVHRISHTTSFNSISLLSGTSDISLQIGLDSTSNSQVTVNGVETTLAALSLATTDTSALTYSVNAASVAGAQNASLNALTALQAALTTVTTNRGKLGGAESRLGYAVSLLQTQRENFLEAEGHIRDADVADEAAKLVRLQILQQAGTAVLAQANQRPSLALQLLG